MFKFSPNSFVTKGPLSLVVRPGQLLYIVITEWLFSLVAYCQVESLSPGDNTEVMQMERCCRESAES